MKTLLIFIVTLCSLFATAQTSRFGRFADFESVTEYNQVDMDTGGRTLVEVVTETQRADPKAGAETFEVNVHKTTLFALPQDLWGLSDSSLGALASGDSVEVIVRPEKKFFLLYAPIYKRTYVCEFRMYKKPHLVCRQSLWIGKTKGFNFCNAILMVIVAAGLCLVFFAEPSSFWGVIMIACVVIVFFTGSLKSIFSQHMLCVYCWVNVVNLAAILAVVLVCWTAKKIQKSST